MIYRDTKIKLILKILMKNKKSLNIKAYFNYNKI